MYIHLGKDTTIKTDGIIGIFDLDTCTISKNTKSFLSRAEKEKLVVNTSKELPKSFVVARKKNKTMVYISQLSSITLKGRINSRKIVGF